jgi:glycosyltransferase involved in cell wall biosynthesis
MIASIASQTLSSHRYEVLVVDGGSDDGTKEKLDLLCKKYDFLQVLTNVHKTVSYALNIGIENSAGIFVCRMDVHSLYPANYLEELLELIRRTGADNVGCVLETKPGKDTLVAIAIAKVLSSPFGVGNSLFRIGTIGETSVDTVPFGFFRRDVFKEIGCFDTDLVRNQDDEFNGRIINAGGEIILTSKLKVSYYSRSTFKQLSNMYYQYGLYKPLVNKKLGSAATVRQFFPLLLFLYSTVGLLVVVLLKDFTPFLVSYIVGAFVYLIAAMSFACLASLNEGLCNKLSCFFAFIVLHLSYGCGYFNGLIVKVFNLRISKVEVSR